MKKNRILATLLLLAMMVSIFAGCSSSSTADTGSTDSSAATDTTDAVEEETAEPLQVALLVQGPKDDDGWNQTAVNGLILMEEQLGAETNVSENLDLSEFEEYFTNYAKAGYDVIIGHGYSFGDAAMKVAPDYPDTYFIITSTDISQEPNLISVENDNAQQGFISGCFAGLYTTSGTVGIVGGMEIPSITAWLEGAIQGIEYMNPDVEVLSNYTGNFEDSVAAKELARSMIEQGADVMLQNCDPAGVGIREICSEEDVTYVGTSLNQYPVVPDICATSGMADLGESLLQVVEAMLDGTIEIRNYNMGVAEDVIYLYEFQDKWVDLVSDEIKDKLDQMIADIKDGTLVIE